MEIWKQIPNFSRYEASNTGKLRSTNYKNSGKTKELKPAIGRDGYLQTMLQSDDKKYHSCKVHYFISLTFMGEKPKGIMVNHLDGNKLNNNVSNYEYTTNQGNIQHAYDHGLIRPKRGELNGCSKLTDEQVLEIREIARTGGRFWGRNKIAANYGVTPKHLQDIVNRSAWNHI